MDIAGVWRGRRRQAMVLGAVLAALAVVAYLATSAGGSPPVITLGAGGGGAEQADGAAPAMAEADGASAARDMMVYNPVEHRFVLADSARTGAGEAAAWRLEPPGDLPAEAERMARHFGLGDVSASPYDDSLQAGATDGSGPSLWVTPAGDWHYSDPSAQGFGGCVEPGLPVDGGGSSGSAGSAGGQASEPLPDAPPVDEPAIDGPADMPMRCAEPTPPAGVPSAAEAEALAASLFDSLDLPGRLAGLEAHADEWGAWAYGQVEVDGHATDLSFSAGYGGQGVLTSVGGTLAEVVKVADYPTVDAETAVERLRGQHGHPGAAGGWLRGSADAAAATDPLDPDTPVSSDEAEGVAAESETASVGEATAQPMPVEPVEAGEPEIVTVTLVGIEPILMLVWDADATTWLVPGYRFTDDAGGFWQVLAVADGYIEFPDAGGEPMPVEVDPLPATESPSDAAAHDPATDLGALAEQVVGLGEDEAVKLVEAAGATVRVVARDGEEFAVTDDLRTDRINLRVEGGRVTGATVG